MTYEDKYRARGRSTKLALRAIVHAMSSPGEKVVFQDHHGTREADKNLARITYNLVRKMELAGFSFSESTSECYMVFHPPWGKK